MQAMCDGIEEKFILFESALEFLDKSGNLNHIKEVCKKYGLRKDAFLYTFKVLVNPAEILEINAKLGNYVLSNPTLATLLFQELVYQCVKVLTLLPRETTLSQICVIIRLTSLPEIKEIYNISHCHELSSKYYKTSYVKLKGIVTGVTATSKYTQSTRYLCPNEDCEGHTGNHFIRVHMPGASEAQTIRKDFKCKFCWTNLEEEKTCRSLADRLLAEMVAEERLASGWDMSERRYREQAIPVFIRGDLTKLVKIGQCYEVIGLIRKDYHDERMIMAIEANNIKKNLKILPALSVANPFLPESVATLFSDRRQSPWRFGLSLAFIFGASVCPPGTFFKLKLLLLLSILSVCKGASASQLLHILAVGSDSNLLHKLLSYAQRFAHRCTDFSSVNYLAGRVTVDRYNSSPYFIEGGSLLLGSNGVCNLGDLSKYKKTMTEQFQTVLSSGRVSIDISSKFTGGLPQQIEQELSCLIWTYSDTSGYKKTSHSDDIFTGCSTGGVSRTMLDAFSLCEFVESSDIATLEEVLQRCAGQQLESAVMTDNSLVMLISDDDFRKYLQVAESVNPYMTNEADSLIHAYYLASRKARSKGDNLSNIPVTALQSICSIAVSHARLCLRTKVTEEDALMAVKLYEESMTARFGYSILSIHPLSHISLNQIDNVLGMENDLHMKQFYSNLKRFCKTQGNEEE